MCVCVVLVRRRLDLNNSGLVVINGSIEGNQTLKSGGLTNFAGEVVFGRFVVLELDVNLSDLFKPYINWRFFGL